MLAAVLALSACGGPRSDASADGQSTSGAPLHPFTVKWRETKVVQSDAKLTFPSVYGDAEVKFELMGLDYVVTCDKCPSDVQVMAFGKPLAPEGKENRYVLRQDVRSLLAPLPVKTAFPAFGVQAARIKPPGKLELRAAGSEPYVADLPEVGVNGLSTAFVTIKDKPVLFGPEDTQAPAAHSVLLGTSGVFGPAKTVQDVDWIVVEILPSRRTTSTKCRYVEGTFPLELQDTEAFVYERRTSKEVARKLFQAPSVCPSNAWATNGTVAALADSEAVKAWAKQQLKR